jgi:transcriptional regulator with XRE-family HTH domain
MQVREARELGSLIRQRRDEVGLTATQAAGFAKVSRRLLIELERGKRPNVSFSAVLRILEYLGLEMDVTRRGLPGVRSSSRRIGDV